MGTLVALLVHLGLSISGGAALLAACGAATWPALPAEALVLGMFVETTLAAGLFYLGCPLPVALAVPWALGLAGLAWAVRRRRGALFPPRLPRPAWHEWVLLAVLAEKALSVARTLAASPIIFDDALTAWAGRGRTLFTGVNFSLDRHIFPFLGFSGPPDYPLAGPVWDAGTAFLAGGWNDVLARADGALAWAVLACALWAAVQRATHYRLAASLAGLAALLLPFPFWHALSGYADLPMAAAVTVSLGLLCRGAYLPAGLAAAATVWTKNDALYIMVPSLLLACLLRACPLRDLLRLRVFAPEPAKALGLFLAGLAACSPWLAFRVLVIEEARFSLPAGLTLAGAAGALTAAVLFLARSRSPQAARLRPVLAATGLPLLLAAIATGLAVVLAHRLQSTELAWHPEAPRLFAGILLADTHAALWPFVAALLLAGVPRLASEPAGRAALAGLLAPLAAVFFIFSCTPAFDFLVVETTVHRSLLQLYGPALLTAFLGLAGPSNKNAGPVPGTGVPAENSDSV